MAARNGSRAEAHPGDILLVVHDFLARSPDELSLAKGDRIELIERDDDFGDGWYLGRHMTNGNTGLFPEVYTRPAPKGTLPNTNTRRASEGPASVVQDGSPIVQQVRHASTGTMQPRPSSASNLSTTSSPISATPIQTTAPSANTVSRQQNPTLNSPVMNETLSVIDEHITDMSTPRQSYLTNGSRRDSSVYSGNRVSRISYIAGHETDEEDSHLHTEEEVMQWSPERVAEHLEDNGVERAHCDVFKEQEISGEVLLAMDQSSVFIKEFDLGPVGRRLKTWHKIKALQDEIRRSDTSQPKSASEYSAGDDAGPEALNRARSSTTGSVLPRALSTASRQETTSARNSVHQPTSQATSGANNTVSPLQSMTSMSRAENTYRPSAQTIRQMQHNRRHSSIDSRQSASMEPDRSGHRKQPSFDQTWQPGQTGQPPQVNGKAAARHSHTISSESISHMSKRDSSLVVPPSPSEADKGYHSSTEIDGRGKGSILHRKSAASGPVSPVQSRANSILFNRERRSTQSGRMTGNDSTQEPVSPIAESPTSMSGFKFGSLRVSSSPTLQHKPMKPTDSLANPIVTKLEYDDVDKSAAEPGANNVTAKSQESEASSTKATPSPSSSTFAFFKDKHKTPALRAISDAVTRKEKHMSPIAIDKISPTEKEIVSSPTKTGSSTPSTENQSFDLPKSENQSRTSAGSTGNLLPPPSQSGSRKPRPKTKKSTSAYTRGLEKKPPTEQMLGCDYSGWMKKKSGSLMATWKPRLFILRGRRLSYYYSDQDTEEKGLIDISFHRVLPAQDEKLTGLHATVTGAAGGNNAGQNSNPTSPTSSSLPTISQQDLRDHPAPMGEQDDGLFIFKLVPPRSGLSKGVNFTKPTVHYFAVNSRQEGRLWMAALMKATIDRDENGQVTTTYSQKTISLAKARARRERPPALREVERAELDAETEQTPGNTGEDSVGLGIGGAIAAAVAGADGSQDPEKAAAAAESESAFVHAS